jgi:hypothetical protein
MMSKDLDFFGKPAKGSIAILLIVCILLTASLACSLPFKIVWTGSGEENQETAQANAAIAELLTTKEPTAENLPDSGEDQAGQVEEQLPTETPSLTPSPTVTDTPKPERITGQISNNTNCRLGPKDVFELIHIFLAGDEVELLGKNQEGTFWYVRDQDGGDIECWIWNEYATAQGNTGDLPVFTPPPEPAPIMNFVLSYKNTSGETNITVNVRNTGNVALQSYTATFKDSSTSETLVVSSNKFGTAAKVSVGNIGAISSGPFSASTIGHQIKVTVKACSEDGQTGKCYSSSINFESN